MTLVHDDQVEEIRRKQLTEVFLVIVSHQLLVQGKIHLIGCDGVFLVLFHIDLVDGLLQRGKVLFDGLVHQHIAVCQVKDLVYRFALQKPVDDLECGVGFAGSGGHHQQQPFLSPGDGVNSPVDGDPLVVTWRVGSLAGKIGLCHGRLLSGRQAGFPLIAVGQFGLRGEFIHSKLPLGPGEEIVLGKAVPIGTESKGQIQHFGIVHRLLQPRRYLVMVIFCFHHCNGIVCTEVEQVIHPLARLPHRKVALQVDLAIGNLGLHGDLLAFPFGSQRRGNVLQLNILFCHVLLQNDRLHKRPPFPYMTGTNHRASTNCFIQYSIMDRAAQGDRCHFSKDAGS